MAVKNKKGKNFEDVQQMNRSLVISLLRKKEVNSRAELAKATGLKQATITNIINDLLECGLVVETGMIGGKKGRRSIGLTISGVIYKVISVRLERKCFSVGLFDLEGTEYGILKEDTDMMSGSQKTLDRIIQSIREIMKKAENSKIIGIGVAIPGPFFRSEGKIGLITEFPGWENVSIENILKETFGLPTFVEHDANVGALAEWWLGSNFIDSGTMVYLAVGQGVGAGVINDGKAFVGAMGIAGEVGHMSICFDGPKCGCGSRGCLEHYCSTIALLREVEQELAGFPDSILKEELSLEKFFEALEAGDALAAKVFERTARYLGMGLVNIIYAYNPHVIIIGDELARAGQRLLDIVRGTVREYVLPVIHDNLSIRLSSFKGDAVLLGAGSLVIDNIKDLLVP